MTPEYAYVCFRHAPTNQYFSGVYVAVGTPLQRHGLMIEICRELCLLTGTKIMSRDINITGLSHIPGVSIAQRLSSHILNSTKSKVYINAEINIEVTPDMVLSNK